jgi:HKD family nuclease
MTLRIQDPRDRESVFLLEAVLAACAHATSGAGAFAFASRAGIKLLLEDEAFLAFLQAARFDLIVGLDAVTDTRALEGLSELAAQQPNLTVRAFMSEGGSAIFHPKLCWFRSNNGASLIVGSGNLTAGGLRGNWEAFTETALNRDEVRALEQQWMTWKAENAQKLLPLDDVRVVERAARNVAVRRGPRARPEIEEGEVEAGAEEEVVAAPEGPIGPVLLAEIPRGGNRWNQANFDIETFRNFFGAEPGRQQRILLTHVNEDGSLAPVESRPTDAVRSQNKR